MLHLGYFFVNIMARLNDQSANIYATDGVPIELFVADIEKLNNRTMYHNNFFPQFNLY